MMANDRYAIMVEPNTEHLTHPKTGREKYIDKTIQDHLLEKNLTQQPLLFVRSDGINVNIGTENVAIKHLQLLLCHQIHYCICQLHGNELYFRTVFFHYDGKLSDPVHCRGPIVKQMK